LLSVFTFRRRYWFVATCCPPVRVVTANYQSLSAVDVDEGRISKPRGRRESIPREIRLAIFQRDDGKCVECGSTFDLQYDHIIPVALGGATSEQNLQLLCAGCNREKGASL
jgi:5-methylcytosine-specific restriction endonuclease McrA